MLCVYSLGFLLYMVMLKRVGCLAAGWVTAYFSQSRKFTFQCCYLQTQPDHPSVLEVKLVLGKLFINEFFH